MDEALLPHAQSIITLYTELEAICDQQATIASQHILSNAVYNRPTVVVVYSMLGDAGSTSAKFLCIEFGIPFSWIPWHPENTPSITCMQKNNSIPAAVSIQYQRVTNTHRQTDRGQQNIFYFLKSRASVFLDLFERHLDCSWKVLGGLYHYAEFVCSWCSGFENMKVWILHTFGWRTPICAPKSGF